MRPPTHLTGQLPPSRSCLTTATGSSLEAVNEARQRREQQTQAGIDQSLLDEAARSGYALGEFEESEEETVGVMEEFFSEAAPEDPEREDQTLLKGASPALAIKLQRKASRSSNAAAAA